MFDDFDTQLQVEDFPESYAYGFETLSLAELEEINAWHDEVETLNNSLPDRGMMLVVPTTASPSFDELVAMAPW